MIVLLLLAAAPSMRATVDASMYQKGYIEVTLSVDPSTLDTDEPRLCTAIAEAGAAIQDLRVDKAAPVHPLADDADCFSVVPRVQTPIEARYRVSLDVLERVGSDADYASKDAYSGRWVTNASAFLLRPEPRPDKFSITLKWIGPKPGTTWATTAEGYLLDPADLDSGTYVDFGPEGSVRELAPIELPMIAALGSGKALVTISRLPSKSTLSDETLRAWVERGIRCVSEFYGGKLPVRRAHILLVGYGSTSAGVFGTTVHRKSASAVLLYGENAKPAGFESDWLIAHELFHMGVPPVRPRSPWFVEGFTTYYQDVMRGRTGMLTRKAAWDDIVEGNDIRCQPQNGRSLRVESQEMRKNFSYQRVYWGGACMAMRVDAAIRAKSKGTRTLDHVLRELYVSSLDEALDEDDLVAKLDLESGGIAGKTLNETRHVDLSKTYEVLRNKWP
jgi:hypothetical protein